MTGPLQIVGDPGAPACEDGVCAVPATAPAASDPTGQAAADPAVADPEE